MLDDKYKTIENDDLIFMAGSLDHCWNQILPELILFSERLEALGFGVIDDEVIIVDGNDA